MRTVWAAVLTASLALASQAPAGLAQSPDAPPLTPLSELRAGVTGYGLTVLHGTTIQRFDVKVLGILTGGPVSHLILFRASGPVITQAGGTASGMSGSPIYVNGRLAGALSYGYHFAGPDADLSLATPIEEMLKVLAPPGPAAGIRPRVYRAVSPIVTPAGLVARVLLMDSVHDAARFNAHAAPGVVAVAPAAVPVFTSQLSPAAFALLRRALGRYNVVPAQRYAGSREFQAPPLEPGSSVGVLLVRGDVEVGAIGTVTYRRGNFILSFGHPLLNAGAADMFMTSAWVDTVVRALDFPFKEGSTGAVVGTATQDRVVGLAGVVGRVPRPFGVRVTVRDLDHGRQQTLGAQVVSRSDLAEFFVPTTVLSLVQQGLDSASGGSAKVRLSLRARGLPSEVVREDLAYDTGDIATASILDVPGATQLLFGNFFKALSPVDMSVDIAVSAQPNTAVLVKVVPQVRAVSPGETLRTLVGLRPYGGAAEADRVVSFTVPRNFPPGRAFLLVGTAGALNDPMPPATKFAQLVQLEGSPQPGVGSLEEAVAQFENENKNTEVLVELIPEAVLTAVGSNANPSFESPAGTSFDTKWVVLGRFQVPITVK